MIRLLFSLLRRLGESAGVGWADDNIVDGFAVAAAFCAAAAGVEAAVVVVDVAVVAELIRQINSPEHYFRSDSGYNLAVSFRESSSSWIAPMAVGSFDNIRSSRVRRLNSDSSADTLDLYGRDSPPHRSDDDDDIGCHRLAATESRLRSMTSAVLSKANSNSCCSKLDPSACDGLLLTVALKCWFASAGSC